MLLLLLNSSLLVVKMFNNMYFRYNLTQWFLYDTIFVMFANDIFCHEGIFLAMLLLLLNQ